MDEEKTPVAKAIDRLLNYGIEKESTAMDNQTRRDVDAACLRLMGWTDLVYSAGVWHGEHPKGAWLSCLPSRDEYYVVPLAEAMRARGWHVVVQSSLVRPGQWEVVLTPNDQVYQSESDKAEIAFADTLPEALALAAARAVGTETEK